MNAQDQSVTHLKHCSVKEGIYGQGGNNKKNGIHERWISFYTVGLTAIKRDNISSCTIRLICAEHDFTN